MKIFFLLLSLIMMAMFFGFAANASAFEITMTDTVGFVGDQTRVTVFIDDAADVLSADITITFDPGILVPADVELTDSTANFLVAHSITWGAVSLAAAGSMPLSAGGGPLFSVVFDINENADVSETILILSRAVVYDADYQAHDALIPGTSGIITLINDQFIAGDINGDGVVNLADAVSVLQTLSSLESTIVANFPAIKNDGKIALEDAVFILQKITGMREETNGN